MKSRSKIKTQARRARNDKEVKIKPQEGNHTRQSPRTTHDRWRSATWFNLTSLPAFLHLTKTKTDPASFLLNKHIMYLLYFFLMKQTKWWHTYLVAETSDFAEQTWEKNSQRVSHGGFTQIPNKSLGFLFKSSIHPFPFHTMDNKSEWRRDCKKDGREANGKIKWGF